MPSWLYRGYTGHEMLPEYGLINMNGRMYDPVNARMLRPDNYVQDPLNSQSYNRYSYCWNNPLKYTDPDGQWVHIVIGAVIGGAINLATNWNNIDNVWEGMAVFGVGAGSGALAATTGGASLGVQLGVAAGTAALSSATNSVIAQTGNGVGIGQVNWGQVGFNTAVGTVAGVAGYGVGQWATRNLSTPLIGGLGINSPVLAGAINGTTGGAIGGAAGGFVAGFAFSGGNFNTGLQGAWGGLKTGGMIGGAAGASGGYLSAKANGLNPWTGKSNESLIEKPATSIVWDEEGNSIDLQPTIDRIAAGEKFPHPNDGSVFKNLPPKGQATPILPVENIGFYREYVHPTPGIEHAGLQRIVTGQDGQMWFTTDHYKTFIKIR